MESPTPPLVLVLMGGPDAEHAVSIASGTRVAAALRDAGGWRVRAEEIVQPDVAALADLLATHGPDVVVPMLHGPWGEGGPLQSMLETLAVPFVGTGSIGAGIAMDKDAAKARARALGVATPTSEVLELGQPGTITAPCVVKPIDDGSSVGVTICRDAAALAEARTAAHARFGRVLVETFVDGRELTVGLIDGEPLPIVEIAPAEGFYDYDAKYQRDDTTYIVDPDLDAAATEEMREASIAIWNDLGLRDVARVDFLLDDEGPWFLEVNTMPGFTDHSLVPLAAAHAGTPMPTLCARLVAHAMRRARPTASG